MQPSLLRLVHDYQKQNDGLVGEAGTGETSERTGAEREELKREAEGKSHQDSCWHPWGIAGASKDLVLVPQWWQFRAREGGAEESVACSGQPE